MPHLDEDRATVAAIRRGSTEAYREIVERHGDLVYSVLRRLVGDPDLADELAQETFVRAYESLDGFRGEARFRTWLVQIAVNLVRDRRRTQRRSPVVVSLEQIRERSRSAVEPRDDRATDEPIRRISLREKTARLERELQRLPHEYREALLLKHVEGLPYDEIARITGDSIGCLKVRVHRARARLRQALADVAREGRDHGRVARTLSRR